MIDYHKVGSFEDLVFSHSDINDLEIHPTYFRARKLGKQGKEDTPSLERGDILHLWLEKKDSFAISEVDKPSGKVAEVMELYKDLIIDETYKNNAAFLAFCGKDYSIDMNVLTEYKNFYLGLHGRVPNEQELRLLIAGFRFCREEAEFGGKPGKKGAYSEETIQAKIKEAQGIAYLRFLVNSRGKIAMTRGDRDVLTNCHNSIQRHPLASQIVALEGLTEHEMYWTEIIDGIEIKRRAKSDKIIVDHANKILTIVDYKTTSYPVTQFKAPGGSYEKYNYGRQIYSYGDAYIKTSGTLITLDWKLQHLFVVVQTTDQNPCMVYNEPIVTVQQPASMMRGLTRVAHHVKTGNWDITMEEQLNNGYASWYNKG